MANWSNAVVHLVSMTTLADDTTTHVVQFQPVDQAFSAGAILGSQGSSNLARYIPVTDLDSTNAYDIHISHSVTPITRIFGRDLIASPGE